MTQKENLATFAESKVTLPSGIDIAYATRGPETGRTILFLHGFIDSWHSFAPMAEFLPPDLRLVALDLRGHGRSSKPAAGYDIEDYASDVEAFCAALGMTRAVVVGQSLGSMIAQRLAFTRPDLVEGLFLIGSAVGCKGNAVVESFRKAMEPITDPISRDFIEAAHKPFDPVPDDVWEDMFDEACLVKADIMRAGLDGLLRMDNSADLGRIKCPVTIVWGENDGIFNSAEQDKLSSLMPWSVFKSYDKASHPIQLQRPKDLSRDLIKLISAL